jgi:hypothetical protein
MSPKIKFFSVIDLLIIVICLTGGFIFFPFINNLEPQKVYIYLDNRQIASYPLSISKQFTIYGKLGKMEILIQDNGVRVLSSCCPHKICVHTGRIKNSGSQIICAPNHILIELKNSSSGDFDAISR